MAWGMCASQARSSKLYVVQSTALFFHIWNAKVLQRGRSLEEVGDGGWRSSAIATLVARELSLRTLSEVSA